MSRRAGLGELLQGWTAEPSVRVIEPRQPGVLHRLSEFWRHRRLTTYFGLQMLEKLYRRTLLGWLWIPLRPVITVVSSAFIFGGLLGVGSGGIPYPLFFLISTAAWDLFRETAIWGTRSLEIGRRTLRRMYAPRLTCLFGSLVMSGTMFVIYIAMAAIALALYTVLDGRFYLELGPETLAVPGGLALLVANALGIACFTAPLAVRARDVRFTLNYALGFWMFLSPVIYPLAEVPAGYRTIVELNPLTAPIEMVRIGVFGEGSLTTTAMVSCAASTLLLATFGLRYFNRSEERSMDAL